MKRINKHNPLSILLLCLLVLSIFGGMTAFAEEASEFTYLEVKYVYQNGSSVGESYTGNFEAGKEYPATTVGDDYVPRIPGYVPALSSAPATTGFYFSFDATNYQFTYGFTGDQVAGNISVEIVYVPTPNVYKAEYYHQSLENSKNFDLVATEAFSGMTGSLVDAKVIKERHAAAAEGFTMREFNAPTIAADGSTVVRVYYDRNYYLLSFDTNGAVESTASQYLPYGAEIGSVSPPTKPGYNFTGWKTGDVPGIPATMPAANTTCVAQWALVSNNANVTIVMWGENANDKDYAYLSSKTVSATVDSTYTFLSCNKEEHTHTQECLTCTLEEHTHTASCGTANCTHNHDVRCYGATSTTGNSTNTYSDNFKRLNGGLVSGRIYRKYGSLSGDEYWLYYNGEWYSSSASACATQIDSDTGLRSYYVYEAKPVEQLCSHVHTQACYGGCGKHTHVASCYGCEKEEHTHVDSCYSSLTYDSSLYTVNTSKTEETSVVVNADGSSVLNVYLDRKKFTITMSYNYDKSSKTYGTEEKIEAKWGQNIVEEWDAISNNAGCNLWSADFDGGRPWKGLEQIMPKKDTQYYMNRTSGSPHTGGYYLQTLDGTYKDTPDFTITYNVNGSMSDEEKLDLEGFEYFDGWKYGDTWDNAKLRYTRKSYDLVLNNGKKVFQTTQVKYEMPLGDVSAFTQWTPTNPPPHPDTIPAAYKFKGWSLSPTGDPIETDINSKKMPASSLMLYACWEAPEYTVLAYDSDESSSSYFDDVVIYSNKVIGLEDPEMEGYKFLGWFYTDDNDVEHAFDPETMYVENKLTLHAKWRSLAEADYTVYFVNQKTKENLAEPQVGKAAVDTSFSVTPKQISGFFPTEPSKSINMTAEGAEVTFEYVEVSNVPYMVKYVDETDDHEIATAKIVDTNTLDVVTVKYVSVEDYIVKEAFLTHYMVVTSENPQASDNVITFFYTPNTTDIMVTVEYYINTDLTGDAPVYKLFSYSQEQMTYQAGKEVTVTPQEIANYELNTENSSSTTQPMPAAKADMTFTFYYDPITKKVTYCDTKEDGNVLQEGRVLVGSPTPPYVNPIPTHPTNSADYVFDEKAGFVDDSGNAPADTVTADATYYAQWAGLFHVHHCTGAAPSKDDDVVEDIRVDVVPTAGFNITAAMEGDKAIEGTSYDGISTGCLYGGLWSDDKATKLLSYTDDKICGLELKPEAGTHYYVREISDKYLTPKTLTVRIKGVYSCVLLTVIDNIDYYIDYGFDIVDAEQKANKLLVDAYDKLQVNYSATSYKTYTADKVITGLKGKLLCYDIKGDGELTFTPFFATKDNVRVNSTQTRTLAYSLNADSSKDDQPFKGTPYELYNDISNVSADSYTDANETVNVALSVAPAFVMGEREIPDVTVTMNVEGLTTELTVPEGTDCSGRITNPSLSGYVFVGWFKDAACTRPANLSCVMDDMEIYAGFMTAGYLQVAELPVATGSDVQRIRLVAAVDMALTASCGFIVSDENGSREIEVADFYDSIDGVKASDLFEGTDEFASLICHDIAIAALEGEKTIAVTPYWIPLTGAKVTGATKHITINGK